MRRWTDKDRAQQKSADPKCETCGGFGLVPNRMDAPGGPICGCGQPSVHESGSCGRTHGPIFCVCTMGSQQPSEKGRETP